MDDDEPGQIHVVVFDQVEQAVVRMNRDALRIESAGQFGRISPSLDVRDLGGRKTDHPLPLIVPEIGIEVVKLPTGRTHDHDVFDHICSYPSKFGTIRFGRSEFLERTVFYGGGVK